MKIGTSTGTSIDTSTGTSIPADLAASIPAGVDDQVDTFHGYELVVGLEVHVELATNTKMFSSSPNRFGDDPNTNIDPVTLGLPGALPVLNKEAVRHAIRIGLALNCSVQPCIFHRKNYFYPDLPKAYQISQYDIPLNIDGFLMLPDGKRIGIERAHMEEDTGKSTHVGGTGGRIHGSAHSLLDFNRCGVPLVEIVSRPDIRTSEQARLYVSELHDILVAIEASDAKMEEGSMRVDANVSVRRPGEPFGTRCEIKNLNSVRSVGRAIEYEMRRQVDLIEGGDRVVQQTRHWDETDGRTHTLRTKEDADDYRYFPEPDLVPIVPSVDWIEELRLSLPVLPAARRSHLAAVTGQPASGEAVSVVTARGQDQYVLAVAHLGGDAGRALIYVKEAFADSPTVPAADLAALTRLEVDGKLSATQAKSVLAELVAKGGGNPAAIAAAKGFEAMDTAVLEAVVVEAIAADPGAWQKYCNGEEKAVGAIVGRVMKATKGQADGKAVSAILQARRSG
jgi:aspartyl-tRNA(Asn)/glutamyl-tRNA(Gln) amidotransferase subunit B